MTRLRAALLSGLAFGLGGVAVGGLRLMDSRSSLVGAVGAAAVLAVVVIVETIKRPEDAGLRSEIAELRESQSAMRAHMAELEIIFMAAKSNAEAALRRSYPDLGGAGVEGSGRHRPL